MAKYQFHTMGDVEFEGMAQALLEEKRRGYGKLIQFGSGKDGGREAIWCQSPEHPTYLKPRGEGRPRNWIFQVKYHDIGLRGWRGAGDAVIADLEKELEKISNDDSYRFDTYVMITNVPLSGVRNIGTRDRVEELVLNWRDSFEVIEVWDASDLSRMLDASEGVRTTYAQFVLPSDIVAALLRKVNFRPDRVTAAIQAYLFYMLECESRARTEEVGDEDSVPLTRVYIDQSLALDTTNIPAIYGEEIETWRDCSSELEGKIIPDDLDDVKSSFAFLIAEHERSMLLAGPGYGKSTITQFTALFYAARFVKSEEAKKLCERLELPKGVNFERLDALCTLRIPFRIELRRYAQWRKENPASAGFAEYIATQLIGQNVEANIDREDIFGVISSTPTFIALDGLDEVAERAARDAIREDLDAFLFRCKGEGVDLNLMMSSRPQGYSGEFDKFHPLCWRINDLSRRCFDSYSESWLRERITNADERKDALNRVRVAMKSDAVSKLATTLLQATVMLTIARKKVDIPSERHLLFRAYVEVVFQRERSKTELISAYERELRMLHERVGFALHEAVGCGKEGALPAGVFRTLIMQVWHDLHAEEVFTGILKNVYDDIIRLAKDRLVFLTGKGEHQTDVDFVLQSYREYFCAAYLSNHTRVDPEKVYQHLVERGGYWENVLQFYFAMAQPLQQRKWILDISSDLDCKNYECLAKAVVLRRAAVLLIPEYSRLDSRDIRKVVDIVFPKSSWWTWIYRSSCAPVLKTLRDGLLWRTLIKDVDVSTLDEAQLHFLLIFESKIRGGRDLAWAQCLYEECMRRQCHVRLAVAYAVFSGLDVDYLKIDHHVLDEGFSYSRSHFDLEKIKSIPDEVKFLFECRGVRFFYHGASQMKSVWDYFNDGFKFDVFDALSENWRVIGSLSIEIPRWCYVYVEGFEPGFEWNADGVVSEYVSYFSALHEAIQFPDDEILHLKARECEGRLPGGIAAYYSCDYLLGPSPSVFPDVRDWRRFKQLLTEVLLINSENSDLVKEMIDSILKGKEATLLALLFHPTFWRDLVKVGVSTHNSMLKLESSSLGKLLSLSSELVEVLIIEEDIFAPQFFMNFSVEKLLTVALLAHEKGALRDSKFLLCILDHCHVGEELSGDTVEFFTERILSLPAMPVGWAGLFFSVILSQGCISNEMLVDLYKVNSDMRLIGVRNVSADLAGRSLALLRSEDQMAVVLGAALFSYCSEKVRLDEKVAGALIVRGLKAGLINTPFSLRLLENLLMSYPTVDEIGFFLGEDVAPLVNKGGSYVISQISQRIREVSIGDLSGSVRGLMDVLVQALNEGKFVEHEFKTEAFDALLGISVAKNPPLREEMLLHDVDF